MVRRTNMKYLSMMFKQQVLRTGILARMRSINVLLVEDNPDHAEIIRRQAEQAAGRITLTHVSTLGSARQAYASGRFDAVLLDLQLPDSTLEETLSLGLCGFAEAPIIVLTTLDESELGAEAVRDGAQDYLVKASLSPDLLYRSICQSIERQRNRRELGMYAAELKRRNEDLRRFAHYIAHEVKSPLSVVTSCLQILSRRAGEKLDDNLKQIMDETSSAVERLNRLINEMLSFARSEGAASRAATVSLAEVVSEARENLRDLFENHGAILRAEDLPQIEGSRQLLVQVFQNLFVNAVRYRREVSPVIQVRAITKDGICTVSVADNGVGIAAEDLEKVFSLFYQGKEPSADGSGIGLAFCRHVVEMHGGRMWAESTPGEGSTFYLAIPIAAETPAARR